LAELVGKTHNKGNANEHQIIYHIFLPRKARVPNFELADIPVQKVRLHYHAEAIASKKERCRDAPEFGEEELEDVGRVPDDDVGRDEANTDDDGLDEGGCSYRPVPSH